MNESAAGEVLLLRAYEQTSAGPRWSDADRAAATRSALQAVGADAPADAFLAARARAGLARLNVRPALPRLPRWLPWGAVALAIVLGLALDRIGSAQRINLLAPPVWALIAWNLGVYLVLLLRAPWAPHRPGGLRRTLAGWAARRRQAAGGSDSAAQQAFAADWAAVSAPLQGARIALALHLAAAALALGLIAGLYLRGLVLDYRVGWESTFLDAATVQRLLSTLLAPASALSGIAVPDTTGMQALRLPQAANPAASAAPWIHLYALQVALCVLLPRLALALWAGLRARKLQRELPLPLDGPYFQRLLRQRQGGGLRIRLWPHARMPDAPALLRLQLLLQRVYGDGAALQVEAAVAYGSEDTLPAAAADGAQRLVLCDLGATPEPESQGRLLQALGRPLLLLDEAAFARRFGAGSPRLDERRAAWSALAASLGCSAVFVDLQAADPAAAEAALQAALEQAAA